MCFKDSPKVPLGTTQQVFGPPCDSSLYSLALAVNVVGGFGTSGPGVGGAGASIFGSFDVGFFSGQLVSVDAGLGGGVSPNLAGKAGDGGGESIKAAMWSFLLLDAYDVC